MTQEWRHCPRCGGTLQRSMLAGLSRLACAEDACGFVHWDNPVPVVAALVEHEGMIVLARNHAWPEKLFGLVTGFLERDEDPRHAVVREVKEELDLDATDVGLIGAYPFPRNHEVIIAYHVVAHGTIRLNEELAEYRRIAPDKLRDWDYGTGLAVRDWLRLRATKAPGTVAP